MAAATEAAKTAQGAAKAAQASSWAAQKDATRAAKYTMRLVRTDTDFDDVAQDLEANGGIAVDGQPGQAQEDADFWSFVPEHAGDDFLDSGADDEEWLGRLKKRFPFGREQESEPKR